MGRDSCYFIFAFICNLYYYVPSLLASPIIGGIEDSTFNIKYHVALHTKYPGEDYKYLCGGSIIDKRYVISAAHCFIAVEHGQITRNFNLLVSPVKVIAGTNKINGPGIESNVGRISIPKAYEVQPRTIGDLAILRLDEDLDVAHSNLMNSVRIGEVHDSAQNIRGSFCGYGFYEGTTDHEGKFVPSKHYSEINRCLTVDIMGTSNVFGKYGVENSYLFATAADRTRHAVACDGDSGAGLIIDDHIVGVLTQGLSSECEDNDLPIQFIRIWDFMSFVNHAMDEHAVHSDMHVLEGSRSHQSFSHHGQNPSSSRTKWFNLRKFYNKN